MQKREFQQSDSRELSSNSTPEPCTVREVPSPPESIPESLNTAGGDTATGDPNQGSDFEQQQRNGTHSFKTDDSPCSTLPPGCQGRIIAIFGPNMKLQCNKAIIKIVTKLEDLQYEMKKFVSENESENVELWLLHILLADADYRSQMCGTYVTENELYQSVCASKFGKVCIFQLLHRIPTSQKFIEKVPLGIAHESVEQSPDSSTAPLVPCVDLRIYLLVKKAADLSEAVKRVVEEACELTADEAARLLDDSSLCELLQTSSVPKGRSITCMPEGVEFNEEFQEQVTFTEQRVVQTQEARNVDLSQSPDVSSSTEVDVSQFPEISSSTEESVYQSLEVSPLTEAGVPQFPVISSSTEPTVSPSIEVSQSTDSVSQSIEVSQSTDSSVLQCLEVSQSTDSVSHCIEAVDWVVMASNPEPETMQANNNKNVSVSFVIRIYQTSIYSMDDRGGAVFDIQLIRNISIRCGCAENDIYVFYQPNGSSKKDIEDFIKKLISSNWPDAIDNLFLFTSAHGNEMGLLTSAGETFQIEELLRPLLVKAKQAILFYQPCRGGKEHSTCALNLGGLSLPEPGTEGCRVPLHLSNVSALFASMPTYASYHAPNCGSLMFIGLHWVVRLPELAGKIVTLDGLSKKLQDYLHQHKEFSKHPVQLHCVVRGDCTFRIVNWMLEEGPLPGSTPGTHSDP